MSVNKLSEEGYTTIFHPENEGVTVHERGTLTIATSNPPVLQRCKEKGDNLWTVSTNEEEGKEEANNVYNLPLTKQSIGYLKPSKQEIMSHGRNSQQKQYTNISQNQMKLRKDT